MPQDQVKDKPEEVKVTSTPPATEPEKRKELVLGLLY
jgi:hypothetical protein